MSRQKLSFLFSLLIAFGFLTTTGCGAPATSFAGSGSTAKSLLPDSGTVAATTHPLVARYSINVAQDAQVSIEFGISTAYGRSTGVVPTPSGGGAVSILVA